MISSGMIDLKFFLTYLGVETELQHSMDGWDEELMTWERSPRYYGLFRSFSMKVGFIKDGATILRTAYYTYGVDATVTIRIEKRNRISNVFETKYTGKIDFSSWGDTWEMVECGIVDTGAAAYVKNRAGVDETIHLYSGNVLSYTAPVALYESVRSLNILQNYLGFSGTGDYLTDTPPGVGPIWPTNTFAGPALFEMPILMGENNFKDINHCLTFYNALDYVWGNPLSYDAWFSCVRACKVRIILNAGEIKYWMRQTTQGTTSSDTTDLQMRIVLNRGGTRITLTSWGSIAAGMSFGTWVTATGQAYEIDREVDLIAGDRIGIEVYAHSRDHEDFDFCFQSQPGATFAQCDIYADLQPFDINVFTAGDLFQELCSRMSGGTVTGISTFLASNTILLTSGDGLRALSDANLVTTFDKFFDFLWSIAEVGFGTEIINGTEYFVLEELSYFMNKNTQSINLGSSTKNLKLSCATDLIYSLVEAGPPDGKYDDLFGKDEYNQQEQWKLPITSVTKTLQLNTVYHTDCLSAAWQVKQNFFETVNGSEAAPKKDSEKDNDIFVIIGKYVETVGGIRRYAIDRDTEVSGCTYNDYMYNASITPKRCILAHKKFMSSILFQQQNDIVFQSGKRNYEVFTGNPMLDENANMTMSAFNTPLFYPIYMEVEAPMLFSYADQNDKKGYVEFVSRGQTYYGFIMSVSARCSKDQSGVIKMLATDQNNVSNFIQ